MVRDALRPRRGLASSSLEVTKFPRRILSNQKLPEPFHLSFELLGPRGLEVVVPVRLGPRNLHIVSEGVELDVVGNLDSLAGVAKVLALRGVHFQYEIWYFHAKPDRLTTWFFKNLHGVS